MGGDVVVESTPGQGSAFSLTFDAHAAPNDAVATEPEPTVPTRLDPDRPIPKLLIVEDTASNRDLLDELLSRIGFATRVASSGEEAIAVHDEWHPDLVLMTLRMPGMGGLEAVRRLRAGGSRAAVIAVTASGLPEPEPEPGSESVDAVVDRFIRKPYLENELFAAIGELLDIHYLYEPAVRVTSENRTPASLGQQLASVPGELRDQLKEAAIQGRARRLESLADLVAEYSPVAGSEIRAVAKEFEYDTLLSALALWSRDDTPVP
jgi:CheY-like chemotaxis protein